MDNLFRQVWQNASVVVTTCESAIHMSRQRREEKNQANVHVAFDRANLGHRATPRALLELVLANFALGSSARRAAHGYSR